MVLNLFSSVANMIKYRGKLVSWSEFSIEDITCNTSTYFVRSFTSKLSGKIYSEDGRPMLKFSRESSGMATNGSIRANSTDFDVFIRIVDDSFSIVYNEKPLGTITASGAVLSVNGDVIGLAKHPPKVSVNIGTVKMRFGADQFPVQLNNRQVATIRVSPTDSTDSSIVLNENFPGESILKVHSSLNEEEEKWLVSLAIIEVVYHGHWMIGV